MGRPTLLTDLCASHADPHGHPRDRGQLEAHHSRWPDHGLQGIHASIDLRPWHGVPITYEAVRDNASIGAVTQVWEDQAVWNVDFCALFPQMRVSELYIVNVIAKHMRWRILWLTTTPDVLVGGHTHSNELERLYLTAMDFQVNVKTSSYADPPHDVSSLKPATC